MSHSPRPILAPSEEFWGERLQLAREFRELTQEKLARAVAASPTLVRYCELGKKREPAHDLVEAFGNVLGFEPGFFYNKLTDVFEDNECSFRHQRTTAEKAKTQVRAHATLIAMVVERLRSVFRFPKLNIAAMKAVSAEEIEAAAEQCRRHWNLGIEGPLVHVGRAAEHAGIFIFPHLAHSEKVDAFSRRGKTTIIFLRITVEHNLPIRLTRNPPIVIHQHTKAIGVKVRSETFACWFLLAFYYQVQTKN